MESFKKVYEKKPNLLTYKTVLYMEYMIFSSFFKYKLFLFRDWGKSLKNIYIKHTKGLNEI